MRVLSLVVVPQRKGRSQGSALSRKAVWLADLVALVVLVLPAVASAAVCTDTWTGPAEGNWNIAEDWSLKAVPTSSDVACVGAKETVKVTEGSNQAGVVQVDLNPTPMSPQSPTPKTPASKTK